MADIKEELKTYLKTNSAITDLVGSGTASRIYTHRAREKKKGGTRGTLPYILVASSGGQSFEHLGGIAGLATTAVNVWACASTSAGADTLAEAIRLAPLQGYRGFINTTKATVSAQAHRDDGYEQSDDGSDSAAYYWTRRVFMITHTEATV